jgi:FKBP-type peptidyl-prolyl cis-trans isomerase
MIKKLVPLALMGCVIVANTSCNAQNGAFKKTANGLEYKIVKDAAGTAAKVGDYMEFHIQYTLTGGGGKDTVLFSSRKLNNNNPVPLTVAAPQFKGDLPEGFTMLSKGDSAVFLVSVDSLMKSSQGGQMPPMFQKGKGQKLRFEINVVNVQTQEERQKQMIDDAAKQKNTDDKAITDYLAAHSITTAKKTASGLYYNVTKPSSGAAPAAGDSVMMNYTGMLLNGQKFDSNIDPSFNHVQPFWFTLGVHQVIPGWDEGIALLPKGTKAQLFIPSGLAYGSQDRSPTIPANSVLIFEVEVVDFKKGSAAPPQRVMPMPQSAPTNRSGH